jgi:FAD/FMN-containing dehydrogenase
VTHFLDSLRACVGDAYVKHEGNLGAWERDWSGSYQGRALAVVLPGTTAQVAQVVKACAAAGVSMVTQGGNTGMVGGGVPDDTGRQVVLSTRRLDHVRGLDAANLTMTAEAGCILQTIQEHAQAQSLLFPLSLAAQGSCTIGGNLATNAGGTQVLRYGNTRELCLGLEVVTADGQIWDGLSGLRKDNTGYDLRDLFIGSEGTLGIITAATLKLQPRPRSQLTAWAVMDSVSDAVALLALARADLGADLTSFELMSASSIRLLASHHPQCQPPALEGPWSVLVEASSACDEATLCDRLQHLFGQAIAQGQVRDAVMSTSLAQSQSLWQVREALPLAQSASGPALRHDISLPISAIDGFLQETNAALAATFAGIEIRCFGHLGDGNLHYNMQAPEGVDAPAYLAAHQGAIHEAVWCRVVERGGSIAAEHGIGQKMVQPLRQYKSAVALGLMQAIKRALDPQALLNPGRVLGIPSS